ncbi:four-helix bundle copper-binding protein [Janthinobacterium sp. CG_23.4]|uniref:four-helix bundle copper-binding protein n=1 Tax=Janthinobacterium sp. CG_23.4 TaxID=2760707 RepID=UPI00247502F8|nr:four-helix bundle copper-binding protein [Janthinobacterium sp. CG_23.4]
MQRGKGCGSLSNRGSTCDAVHTGSIFAEYDVMLLCHFIIFDKELGMKNSSSMAVSEMQSCIDACAQCHQICLKMAMTHCLKMGGKHVEPDHFRLMVNCAEICQTSANFQLSGSAFSARLCAVCADICQACADSCRELDGMEECVQACDACASSCRSMAA